jgi:hypothetical protein
MIKVTKQEMIRFIKAQRNDRPVNMGNGHAKDHIPNADCCVMTHFGRSRGWWFDFSNSVGRWEFGYQTIAELEVGIFDLFKCNIPGMARTYGELKARLKK